MIKKLKEKGFVSSEYDKEMLEGEFNGTDVYVHVVTNNNKVWRIAIEDVNVQDEYGIVLRFNRLCGQFENNRNYSKIDVDFRIPDYEDIEYEMTVNNKRYDAGFYQVPRDTMAIKSSLRGMIIFWLMKSLTICQKMAGRSWLLMKLWNCCLKRKFGS